MTLTGTQNRQYDTSAKLMVRCEFIATEKAHGPPPRNLTFDWNDRAAVRNFATISDAWIRKGGQTVLEQA